LANSPLALIASLSPEAEYHSGQRYDSGYGVPQDFALAAYWFRRAADRGYPPAELALARYYARGTGVPKDLIRAYILADWAASRLPPGTPEGDAAQSFRDYVRFKLTAPQLALAQQLSTGWPPLAAADPLIALCPVELPLAAPSSHW
jgi:TPR repeat protein